MSLPLETVDTFVVRLPTRRDFRWSGLDRPLGETMVVKVTSGEFSGYGETVPLPDWSGPHDSPFGETPEIDEVVLHTLVAPRIVGHDAASPASLRARARAAVHGYPYAKAALDIAVHDLVGRAKGVPVFDLLGGRRRREVVIAHMLGLGSVDHAEQEARDALDEGCRAFQVKGGQDADHDVELIRRLRAVGGSGVTLRVDANCGYRTPKAAIAAVRALAEAGADMVEQPVADLADLRRVTESTPIPIIADEACWTASDAVAAIRHDAVDALSVYVAKAGGIAGAAAVTQVAAAAGLPHDLNGSLEAGVGNLASLHVAVSSDADLLPSVLPVSGPAGDLPTRTFGRYFLDDVIATCMKVDGGSVLLDDSPGLGVDVDETKLASMSIRHRRTTLEEG